MARRRSTRLWTQVFVLQLVIILVTVGAGFAVSFLRARHELEVRAGDQSLAIARTVAASPDIISAFASPDPPAMIDPIAEAIRGTNGAAFVVVVNRAGVRYSHPNPAMIGTSLLRDPGEDPAPVLAGKTFVGVQPGSLGRSVRAKVPIRDTTGQIVGLVSVGVLEATVGHELRSDLTGSLIPPLLGLALGTLGALLLARRLKRQTFGLEPDEIAALLEQREAMLHGVREGTITVDTLGRLTLINDEAARLLGLDHAPVGTRLDDFLPEGRVRDVLTGAIEGRDEVVVVGSHVLVVNRMPVEVRGRPIGAVVTLRDRTELDGLLRELDDVRSLSDALRAQEHEFSNRLHTIGGLIELGRYDEAVQAININSTMHQELAASLFERVSEPIVSALLLGKASVASERGVNLSVSVQGELPVDMPEPHGLITILGNLIDNGIESASQRGVGGHVEVSLAVEGDDLTVKVHDSGPGVDPSLTTEIFRDGFTTKVAHHDKRRRGLGLALVSQEVRRRGGSISVTNIDGAMFTVVVPIYPAHHAAEMTAP